MLIEIMLNNNQKISHPVSSAFHDEVTKRVHAFVPKTIVRVR